MTKAQCDECGTTFDADVKEYGIAVGDDRIAVKFFACPSCSHVYKVGIRDAKSLDLEYNLEKEKKKIAKMFGVQDEALARAYDRLCSRKLRDLRKHCEYLDKKFAGTFTFVAYENNNEGQLTYTPCENGTKGKHHG